MESGVSPPPPHTHPTPLAAGNNQPLIPGDLKDPPEEITTKDPKDDASNEQPEQTTEAKDSAGEISG